MEVYLNMDIGDPARYNAEPCDAKWVDSVCAKCADHGVKKLFWRTSLGRAYYQSKVVPPVDRDCGQRWQRVAEVLERMDPLAVAVEKAHKHGIELWAWWPFSETHVVRGDLNFIDPFYAKRLDLFWCNRDGSRHFLGHPCPAEPEVHQRIELMAQELSNDYQVDGVLMSTRTHCTVPGESRRGLVPYTADEFGYNWPIVEEFRRRYGVDITREDFDQEKWHRLKGEYLTRLFHTVKAVLDQRDKKLWVDVSPQRYRFISNLSDERDVTPIYQDWKEWVQSGAVEGIVAVTPRNDSPEASIVDMSPIRTEVPDNLYCWIMCMANRPVAERKGHLRLENMLIRSAETYERILEMAKEAGARGVIGHEMYTVLFTDWSGQEVNPVPDDPKAYWSVIKKMHDRG